MDKCAIVEKRIVEAPVDGLESLVGKLALLWNAGQIHAPPLRQVLDFLAEPTP